MGGHLYVACFRMVGGYIYVVCFGMVGGHINVVCFGMVGGDIFVVFIEKIKRENNIYGSLVKVLFIINSFSYFI